MHHTGQQEQIEIALQPRIKSNDLAGAYYAVLDGLGIADLPYLTVQADIEAGRLIHLFPNGAQMSVRYNWYMLPVKVSA